MFAQSTIDATVWLMVFHPERVRAWLDRHAPGLEAAAMATVKDQAKLSAYRMFKGAA